MQAVVDTHIHIWNFSKAEYEWLKGDTSILNRDYDIGELDEERKKVGIQKGVLVQAANNYEDTDWMLQVAADNDWIKGVVGWLPLTNSIETGRVLGEKYFSDKYFKGVRHLIHDEPDPAWLLQDQVIESLQIISDYQLSYDVVGVLSEHIETTIKLANRLPSLKLVFDHLNQPPISTGQKFGRWGELMKEAAGNQNLYVKISGLGSASKNSNWSASDIQPYIEFVLEHFGVDRCFLGGDWPVSLLGGSYTKTWTNYFKVVDSLLNEEERHKIYYKNAVDFYRL